MCHLNVMAIINFVDISAELDQPATAETAESKLAEDIPKTDDSSMPELPGN